MTSSPKKHRRLALITGGSSGIGKAYARKLAYEGLDLVLVARREPELSALCQSLEAEFKICAAWVRCDLSNASEVNGLLERITREEWDIDLFINNAGFGTHGSFTDLDLARELTMVDLNCKALVALSYGIAKQMKARGNGTIVHTASVGGLAPTPYFAVYGATKAFVVSFSESLACELKPFGVTVQTLCPGATETEFGEVAGYTGDKPPAYAVETAQGVVEASYSALQGTRKKSLVVTASAYRATLLLSRLLPRQTVLSFAAKMNLPRVPA